ncbi:hypothetical protein F5144DRAFT_624198 [Chaetomium tenue]|uniref:Uncharacterized protein n=1 Tax=Chaetomium tenue TaxID=1854479 RepID=A0ACB7NVM4_9PEZI|nr:hypothetical protein F5144DRAFT_624198 [Chaetomium globosum]
MEDLDISPARDFSDSNLKPEPLRLPRRIHLGHQNDNLHSPSNHFHTDKPTLRKHRPNRTGGETTSLVRPTTSELAVLVAKFEMLGAAGDGNARASRQPANVALTGRRWHIWGLGVSKGFNGSHCDRRKAHSDHHTTAHAFTPATPYSEKTQVHDKKSLSEPRAYPRVTNPQGSLPASLFPGTRRRDHTTHCALPSWEHRPQWASGYQQTKEIQNKRPSVADLRRAFDPQQCRKSGGLSSASLPNTPNRTWPLSSGIPNGTISQSIVRGSRPQLRGQAHCRDAIDIACSPTRIPEPQNKSHARRRPQTPTIRQAEGKGLRANLIKELSRTMSRRNGGPKQDRSTDRTLINASSSSWSDSEPLLLSRTVSAEGRTICDWSDAGSQGTSPNKRMKQGAREPYVDSGDTLKVSTATTGEEPASYLQHWRTKGDRRSLKSSPSLPKIVQTTIAASTRSSIRQSSSPDTSSLIHHGVRPEALTRTQPHALYTGRSGDDTTGGASEAFGSDVANSTEPSPVKERIHLFENMGRPLNMQESAAPSSVDKVDEPPEIVVEGLHVEKRQTWQRRLASQTLRSVSLTGRRKVDATKGRSEPTSRIPILKRHGQASAAGVGLPQPPSSDAKREASFSFKATFRKISKSNKNFESRLPSATKPVSGFRATPSLELLNKTAKIAPRPIHKAHLNTKPIHAHESNGTPTEDHPAWANRPSHVNSSTGMTAGMSWGRRAAAAALDIGRRFKTQTQTQTRKTSTSGPSALSYTPSANTTPGSVVAGGNDGEYYGDKKVMGVALAAEDAEPEVRSHSPSGMAVGGMVPLGYGCDRGG